MIGIVYPISEVDVIQALSTHGSRRSLSRTWVRGGEGGKWSRRRWRRAPHKSSCDARMVGLYRSGASAGLTSALGTPSSAAPILSVTRVLAYTREAAAVGDNPTTPPGIPRDTGRRLRGRPSVPSARAKKNLPRPEPCSRETGCGEWYAHEVWPRLVHQWPSASRRHSERRAPSDDSVGALGCSEASLGQQ